MTSRVATCALKQAISISRTSTSMPMASSSMAASRRMPVAVANCTGKRSYMTMMTVQDLEKANNEEIARYAYGGVAALLAANGFVVWTEAHDHEAGFFRNASAVGAAKLEAQEQESVAEHLQTQQTEEHEHASSSIPLQLRRSRQPLITLHMKW